MSLPRQNLYEGMYVISATLSDDARNKALDKIQVGITGRGGEIVKIHDQGRRRLAYEIDGHREGLSTPQVYRRLDVSTLALRDPEEILTRFLDKTPLYFNDLEIPAFEAMPELKGLKQELLHCGYSTVLMSGSGSSFFCLGVGSTPTIPDITTFPANFTNRFVGGWYI